MAYEKLEGHLDPLWRTDYAAAGIASLLAEINRNEKKKKKPFSRKDFMTDWEATAKKVAEQSPEQQMGLMRRIGMAIRGSSE